MVYGKRDAILRIFKKRKTLMVNTSRLTHEYVVLYCTAEPPFLLEITRNSIDICDDLGSALPFVQKQPTETDALLSYKDNPSD